MEGLQCKMRSWQSRMFANINPWNNQKEMGNIFSFQCWEEMKDNMHELKPNCEISALAFLFFFIHLGI